MIGSSTLFLGFGDIQIVYIIIYTLKVVVAKKKKREHLKQLKARKKAIKREKIKFEKERKAAML